ncbi:MAG: lysophospholipid acyltransferase family protein [Planctomycetota bacterium]
MRDFDLEPAHDLGLPSAARQRSVQREAGLRELLASHAWWAVARTYLKLAHRLEVVGREHLPAEPPFVLVANHTSHLDAPMLAAALPPRHRRYTFPVSAGDVFFETKLASAFSAVFLNALPMWRKHAGRHALDDLRKRLTCGTTSLILFPEGTRSPDGVMQKFKPGIGMLVAGTDVPVFPCYLEGAHAALPKGAKRPRPTKLRARVAPPLRFGDTANDKRGWCGVAQCLQREVIGLAPGHAPPPEDAASPTG